MIRDRLQMWIWHAFAAHCKQRHNAEFEVCRNPRCRRAAFVERVLYRWLYEWLDVEGR